LHSIGLNCSIFCKVVFLVSITFTTLQTLCCFWLTLPIFALLCCFSIILSVFYLVLSIYHLILSNFTFFSLKYPFQNIVSHYIFILLEKIIELIILEKESFIIKGHF
jgi:hypothetical protein